jgi:hypothetical protein
MPLCNTYGVEKGRRDVNRRKTPFATLSPHITAVNIMQPVSGWTQKQEHFTEHPGWRGYLKRKMRLEKISSAF